MQRSKIAEERRVKRIDAGINLDANHSLRDRRQNEPWKSSNDVIGAYSCILRYADKSTRRRYKFRDMNCHICSVEISIYIPTCRDILYAE